MVKGRWFLLLVVRDLNWLCIVIVFVIDGIVGVICVKELGLIVFLMLICMYDFYFRIISLKLVFLYMVDF